MTEPFQVIQVESRAFASKMEPVNVIRAPSLKRGKPDERLTDRVSVKKCDDDDDIVANIMDLNSHQLIHLLNRYLTCISFFPTLFDLASFNSIYLQ